MEMVRQPLPSLVTRKLRLEPNGRPRHGALACYLSGAFKLADPVEVVLEQTE